MKCRTYRGYIIREEHEHYVIIGNDKILSRVDTIEEAKEDIDFWEDSAQDETKSLAERIIKLDVFGARDAGVTVESLAEEIKKNPAGVMLWLMDYIDENT